MPAGSILAGYPTAEGPVGLYLTNRRAIIEVKRAGGLSRGPYAEGTGSAGGETAFEQLDRRLRAERARERLHRGDGEPGRGWIGAVTDCRVWYAWEWGPEPGPAGAASRIDAWHGRALDGGSIGELARLLARAPVGKEWATADMPDVLRGARRDLAASYARRRGLREVRMRRELWLAQMGAGGGGEPDDDVDGDDDAFVAHTLLVLAARMVRSREDARYGFAGWAPDGVARKVRGAIDGYDWSQHAGDALRALCGRHMPARHRPLDGGRRTPEWLAEAVCGAVIDDGFIGEQVRRFRSGGEVEGVLDPACGTGTILYHAVRRITESGPVRRSRMGRPDAARLASLMVRGMDAHPVAVEIARASAGSLLRAAGCADGPAVYQGDSLLVPRPESTLLGAGGDDLPLTSPRGSHFVLPARLVESGEELAGFVRSAVDGAGMPGGPGRGPGGRGGARLAEPHARLAGIAAEEGGGSGADWLWHISNQAGAMGLRGAMGRIASNPPWAAYGGMRDGRRKDDLRRMAAARGLWVAGPGAGFDLAALFVDKCAEMYLARGGGSGWILPRPAIKGRVWSGLRAAAGGRMSAVWDIGGLAFQRHACVMFLGVDAGDRRLAKGRGGRIGDGDAWAHVSGMARWDAAPHRAEEKESEWLAG